nr:MAG TPA: hypothetical protein [Caudoviricetes sp.]
MHIESYFIFLSSEKQQYGEQIMVLGKFLANHSAN